MLFVKLVLYFYLPLVKVWLNLEGAFINTYVFTTSFDIAIGTYITHSRGVILHTAKVQSSNYLVF